MASYTRLSTVFSVVSRGSLTVSTRRTEFVLVIDLERRMLEFKQGNRYCDISKESVTATQSSLSFEFLEPFSENFLLDRVPSASE